MIFSLKHFGAFVLLLTLLVGTSAAQAQPAAPSAPAAPSGYGNDKAKSCGGQFGTFISGLMFPDSPKDYFDDLFQRNRCQQDDIFALDEKIETLMDELREQFFESCSSPDISDIDSEIKELRMEQYFVRHIVPVVEDTTYKKDLELFEENFEAIKMSLTLDMKERFVVDKKWATEEEFESLMNDWLTEYEDRFEKYIECPSSPWQEVAEEWQKFEKGIQALSEINAGPTEEDEDEEEDETASGEKNSAASSAAGFFDKLIEFRIAELEPEKGLQALTQDIRDNGTLPTVKELQELQSFELVRYEREATKAELLATYELLYSKGSADITHSLVQSLKDLSSSVTGTTNEELKKLKEAAKALHEKQGKTSPN